MRSRELERAQRIEECLQKCLASRGDRASLEEYSDRLKGAPAEVMDNGLLQMLAFYHHKKGPHDAIARDLEAWLQRQGGELPAGDALEKLVGLPATQYRRCSEEAIAWLNLAKRLVAARVAMRGVA
jgi:CRISPR-associated protein Cmr5